MNINSTMDYQLSFEAKVGSGFAGDIAIDDISVSPGRCPEEKGCDFEGVYCERENLHNNVL